MVAWTQLLLLACVIALSASQTCDNVTCCSGLVCIDVTPGESGTNWTKCVQPTSCDQLDCPDGQVCVNESRGFGAPPKVSCQASCDYVQCPDFLQCVERVSGTECVIPNECLLVECPFGTTCYEQQIGNKMAAVCYGQSCSSVDCFDGSECFDITVDRTSNFLAGKKQKSRTNSDTTSTGTSGSGEAISSVNASTPAEINFDFAVCLPTCERADICPPGLVCEVDKYQLVCREPESCDELDCPMDQECQEVECEHGRAHGTAKTNSRRSTGTKTYSSSKSRENVLYECANVEPESGSGMENLMPTVMTTEPSILERVGNDQNSLLGSSAHSLVASAVVLVLPMCVYSLLFL